MSVRNANLKRHEDEQTSPSFGFILCLNFHQIKRASNVFLTAEGKIQIWRQQNDTRLKAHVTRVWTKLKLMNKKWPNNNMKTTSTYLICAKLHYQKAKSRYIATLSTIIIIIIMHTMSLPVNGRLIGWLGRVTHWHLKRAQNGHLCKGKTSRHGWRENHTNCAFMEMPKHHMCRNIYGIYICVYYINALANLVRNLNSWFLWAQEMHLADNVLLSDASYIVSFRNAKWNIL